MRSGRRIPLLALLLAASCNQSAKQSAEDSGKDEDETAATDKSDTSTSSIADEEEDDAFHTGFDGSTDYSLLIPRFRSLKVKDESIAKVESVEVTLSATVIDELVAKAKAENPDFESTKFKEMLGRKQTTYKVTPLKAGKTQLITSGGRGGGQGKQQSGWGKSTNITLVVTEYTSDQLAAGKARYDTDGGGGNLKACKSCHETGEEGAPPHELGRIMEIPDKGALQWIKTGAYGGREASIEHAWEFSSDTEEKGIVPYLRSKQTHDVETLTKLYVEEMLANGGFMGPPPGEGGTKSSTSTGTATE